MISHKISTYFHNNIIFLLSAKHFYLIACIPTNHVHFSQFPTKIFRPVAEVVRKMLIHWRSLLSDKPPCFRPAKRYSCHGTDEIATIFYPMDQTWLPFVVDSFVFVVFTFGFFFFFCDCCPRRMSPIAYANLAILHQNQSGSSEKKTNNAQ